MLSLDSKNRLKYAVASNASGTEIANAIDNAFGANPSGGQDYYVDGNTNNPYQDGLSWATAVPLLSTALALSHANIADSTLRNWARRNRIFVIGDTIAENLTKLAQKTDVIGVGTCDGFGDKCRIEGNHAIVGTYYGCRFINCAFIASGAGATIFTLVAGQAAAQFIGCDFLTAATTVIGIKATAVTDLQILGCRFLGSWSSSWSTAAISLLGACHRAVIDGNTIQNTHATGVGVLIDAGFTANGPALLTNNNFETTAMALNDAAAALACLNNYFIVGTAKAINTSIVYAAAKAANNFITGSDGSIKAPVTTP